MAVGVETSPTYHCQPHAPGSVTRFSARIVDTSVGRTVFLTVLDTHDTLSSIVVDVLLCGLRGHSCIHVHAEGRG